jgi:hypothetical protein
MSSSQNQKTCVVADVPLPALGADAHLRVVSIMGEVTFANAAAVAQIGTDSPNIYRTLFASDAAHLSYLAASLAGTPAQSIERLSIGVQTTRSYLADLSQPTETIKISVCVLDLARVTLVDVDGAAAIGTIGQHLARLTKKVRETSDSANCINSQSHVYVVIGNEAPSNLYSDTWIKSKLDDAMIFRSLHGAMREWQNCISDVAGLHSNKNRDSSVNFLDIDGNYELVVIPDAESIVSARCDSPHSPAMAPMRNREGSFSGDMRARQGSFHL